MAEKIEVTFLGTGSAIPTARRNHSATLIQYKDEMILFDCGEGTQRQFRKAKINMCKITKILISHWHADHTLGIPGLFQTMAMNGYSKCLKVYGPRGSKEKIREILNLFGIDDRRLRLEVHEVSEGKFIDEKDFFVESMPMEHGIPTNGYSFSVKEKNRLDRKKLEKLKLPNSPLMGDLIKGKTVKIDGKKIDGKKLMYVEPQRKITMIVDSKYTPNAIKLANDADVLTCEASFSEDDGEVAGDHGHMNSVEAATIAKKAKAKKLILVHLSQRYDMIPKKILSEAKKVFKETVVAEDFDKLVL
ncbi:MAG: ribonuclease Z [archaeon]|nr:ribonuclease Z [archaeon]MCR4323921.1 ribonuclease Z [Nanoarchaeota archaeon]